MNATCSELLGRLLMIGKVTLAGLTGSGAQASPLGAKLKEAFVSAFGGHLGFSWGVVPQNFESSELQLLSTLAAWAAPALSTFLCSEPRFCHRKLFLIQPAEIESLF